VFGIHPVRVCLRRNPGSVVGLSVLASRGDPRMRELLALAAAHGIAVREVAARELDAMSGGGNHQGVVAAVREAAGPGSGSADWPALVRLVEAHREQGVPSLLLVLDGVQDPHNLGACLRSAAAAGAHAVVVPRRRAAGMTGTVRKVASGAAEIVPLVEVTNLVRALAELARRGVTVVGADARASLPVYDVDLRPPVALVLGGEGRGVRRLTAEACDWLVAIPMPGAMESLNVSVAAGVCLFEAVRQRLQDAALA